MNHKEDNVLGNGRYRLIKTLGEGTYGVVWLAEDSKLKIKVAIKTLHPSMGKIADLQKEAVTQARFNYHQNIATIYEVDIDDRFIAMEYIEGESLENCLRTHITNKTWISRDKAVHFLTQCFEALMCAHEQLVIHGDIKPANLMIHKDDMIKLTDFGVAKVISEQLKGYATTNIARRLGSITYTAPEVLKGEPRNFKSDLFSLGIIAYLLFTGRHPFYSTDPSGLFSIREKLLSDEEPEKPREINPDIPEVHENVIMKMLAKNPENRYTSVKQAYEEFTDIGLVCQDCKFKNPFNAKFCSQCGRSLEKVREEQYKGKLPIELWSRAFQMNATGEFEEAIKFCDEAIKMKKDFADAYQTKGFALSNLGEPEEAMECYQKALKYSTDRVQKANIHTNRSYIYMIKGDHENMIKDLKKALEYNPYHGKARALLEKYQ
ncbi:MAG: protein kinase [Methanophagales archaeon]|nr:protein kinase [Methanophagales archaeon]